MLQTDAAAARGGDKIRVGFFGGSFNPVHNGHIALARHLLGELRLDEVWFVVSPQNPFKQGDTLLDDALRLEMVRLALKDEPRMAASDYECHLPRPSYTWRTLQGMSRDWPERDFVLLIGADNWLLFDRWRESRRIVDEYRVCIYPRRGYDIDETKLPPTVRYCRAPLIEISSTQVRQGIAAGKNMNYFVPQSVYTYIINHRLYKNNE